jgi:hypothetical protein
MFSFREFKEKKEETKALEVVMKGMNLQSGGDFWTDFLSLCGNAGGMAELLDVPREKVTALAGRIARFKEMISDEGDEKEASKDRLMKTGGNL